MNRQLIIKRYWSVIGLTAATMLLLTTVFAACANAQEFEYSIIRLNGRDYFEPADVDVQMPLGEADESSNNSEADEPSPINDVAEAKVALDLKLRALNPATCVDSSLWLEVEITNTGLKPVKIGRDEVWASFSYQLYRADSDEVRHGATFYSGSSLDYVVLRVGESYRDTYELSLEGKVFFRNVDRFALNTKIESIESNEVMFGLSDCGNTKEEAKEQ